VGRPLRLYKDSDSTSLYMVNRLSIFLKYTFHYNFKLTSFVVKYLGLPFEIKFKAENKANLKLIYL